MEMVLMLSFLFVIAGLSVVVFIKLGKRRRHLYAIETEYVRKAKEYMESHFKDEELSRDDVAHFVGLTPAYFGKLFKKQSGENFIDYLNRFRLIKAKQLLETTDMNMAEITFAVGFNSQSYFGLLFKRKNRMSPKQYRMKFKKRYAS